MRHSGKDNQEYWCKHYQTWSDHPAAEHEHDWGEPILVDAGSDVVAEPKDYGWWHVCRGGCIERIDDGI